LKEVKVIPRGKRSREEGRGERERDRGTTEREREQVIILLLGREIKVHQYL
jgi:hypothetical protein